MKKTPPNNGPSASRCVALAALLALMLAACGTDATSEVTDAGSASSRQSSAGQSLVSLYNQMLDGSDQAVDQFPEVGVTLTDVPTGDAAISRRQAITAVARDGIRPDAQHEQRPTATLRLLDKLHPFPSDRPVVADLVWDVVFADAPQRIHVPNDRFGAGPPVTGAPCDLHVLVDAMSGAVLEGFQVGCHLAP